MKRWLIIAITSVVVAIIVAIIIWRVVAGGDEAPRTVTVESGTIVQDVEFTGRLTSKISSDLSFEVTGTVADIVVKEGDAVTAGQTLATLNPSMAELDVSKASADLAAAKEQKRLAYEAALRDAKDTRTTNAKSLARKRQVVLDAKKSLDQAQELYLQTERDSGDSATTETAIANLKTKEAAYNDAQAALSETTATIKQTNQAATASSQTAAATYSAILYASGEDSGISALGALKNIAQTKLSKHVITAPYDGVITTRHKEVGETALVGTNILTLATVSHMELTSQVTETDAAKLATDMSATITFDALPPQDHWNVTISYIAPAAKIVEGVPTYTVKLQLEANGDARLKPGLTSNITVHAASKDNVLSVPRRAVITQATEQFVLVLEDDGSIGRYAVSTGLIGSDGSIEITHGLSTGQKVIIDSTSLRDQQ